MKRVLIIGGYGNFGSFITGRLAKEPNIQLIIAGRSVKKAKNLAEEVNGFHKPEIAELDVSRDMTDKFAEINPNIVIHTSGPFQGQGYKVAEACIVQHCHYIDLADGRGFVEGMTCLDERAKDSGILLITGASSVPCLTSAIVDHYQDEFQELKSLDYGITTAQKTNRGLATTSAILSYTGKVFDTLVNGHSTKIYGMQDLHARKYEGLGWRLLGNCDIPDLSLFPKRYPALKTIRFYAGLEISFLHLTLWGISWLVRWGLVRKLEHAAPLLLKIAYLFDKLGSMDSGFYMIMSGKGPNGTKKTITFELIARSGDGPYIPCMPAILLARKLANGSISETGAYPCIGFIDLKEYLEALGDLDIVWTSSVS